MFSVWWRRNAIHGPSTTTSLWCDNRTDLHQRLRQQSCLRQHGGYDAAMHGCWTASSNGGVDLGGQRSPGRLRADTPGTAHQRIATVPGVCRRRIQRGGPLGCESALPGHQRRRNCRQQTGSSQSRSVFQRLPDLLLLHRLGEKLLFSLMSWVTWFIHCSSQWNIGHRVTDYLSSSNSLSYAVASIFKSCSLCLLSSC